MENFSDNIHKFKIFQKTYLDPTMPLGYGFAHGNKNKFLSPNPEKDFYLPIFITRTSNLMEYVDVTRDDTIFTMQRQEINPWFIEFSFFDTIKRNKVNNGADLTAGAGLTTMINFIRSVRPEIATFSDANVRAWFDNIGKFEFPWNKGGANQTDLDTLDKLAYLNTNIISKAFKYGIDINK